MARRAMVRSELSESKAINEAALDGPSDDRRIAMLL